MRRTLLGVTIAAVVLYLIAAATIGTTPKPTDDGAAVAQWFSDHGDRVRLYEWVGLFTLPLLGVYAAIVRDRLPRIHRDVWAFGAALFLATTMVQTWFWLGLAWHADALQPATARTLLDIASFWGPMLTMASLLLFGPITILAFGGDAGVPRWVGYVTGVTFVEQAVETVTVFGKTGFIAPGGPMNLLLGAGLFILSLIAIAIAFSRAEPAGT